MLKAKEKIKATELAEQNIIRQTAAIFLTVILSVAATRSTILGYLSPVNAVVAAVSGSCGIFAFLAAAVTYIVIGELRQGLFQLSSMVFIFAGEFVVDHFNIARKNILVNKAFITSGAMLASTVITSAFSGFDPALFGYRLLFSVLCGCLVYFVSDAKNRAGTDGILDLNGTNGASVGIIYVVLTSTLSSVEIFNVNIGIVFGTIAILFSARKYSHIGGAVCGALTTCAVLIYSPELAHNTLLLSVSGLLCGALSAGGAVVTALAFVFACAIGLMAVGYSGSTFPMLLNFAVGAVVFAAIPENRIRNLFKYIGGNSRAVYIVGQTASSRLKFTSGTLKDVRRRLLSISDTLEKKKAVAPLSQRVRCTVCTSCKMKENCWKEHKPKTMLSFIQLEKEIEQKGRIDSQTLLMLVPDCICGTKLLETFNNEYSSVLCERTENRKITDLRELLSEQLLAMEDLLSDLSYKVEKITEVDAALSERVKRYMSKQGIAGVKVCVYNDENSMKRVEIFSSSQVNADFVKMTVDIGVIIDCELDMPVVSATDGMNRLLFCPRPDCQIKSGIAQLTSKNESLSGDTLERIWLSRSEYAVILSDGMGTGKRAKLDSSFAVSLVSRFLASGISPETSFRLINSILRVKGWDESFATADLVIVDLCRKTARFVKAGAAPSYISRGRDLVKVEEKTFPLGILAETLPACREIKLADGDRIIIASDGVSEETIIKAAEEFLNNDFDPAQAAELVAAMSEKGKSKCGENVKSDDISVCVLDVFVND